MGAGERTAKTRSRASQAGDPARPPHWPAARPRAGSRARWACTAWEGCRGGVTAQAREASAQREPPASPATPGPTILPTQQLRAARRRSPSPASHPGVLALRGLALSAPQLRDLSTPCPPGPWRLATSSPDLEAHCSVTSTGTPPLTSPPRPPPCLSSRSTPSVQSGYPSQQGPP